MTPDDPVITDILAREGDAYTDRAADRGGPTKWGITMPAYSDYLKTGGFGPATAGTIATITEAEARAFYAWYLGSDPVLSHVTDARLFALLSDTETLHGRGGMVRILQRALHLKDDGVAGSVTQAALAGADQHALVQAVVIARALNEAAIIAHDPEVAIARASEIHLQAENALGWATRTLGFLA